jgi:hypothetical protein
MHITGRIVELANLPAAGMRDAALRHASASPRADHQIERYLLSTRPTHQGGGSRRGRPQGDLRSQARRTVCQHSPGPATPCASRKWSADPLQEQENRAAARFVKPSAGLEPATPSLPWPSGLFARPRTTSQVPGPAPKWRSTTPTAHSIVRHPALPTGYPAEPSPVRRPRPC